MATTPRTPDDGRNERQRQQQEQDARPERVPDDGRNERRVLKREENDDERQRLLDEKPFDFIERTRPEDPTGHVGQQTRDNVNPAIPSAEPGTGDIVDPNTLGMDQSQQGTPPPAAPAQREQWPKTQEQQQAAPDQQHTDEQDLAMRNHLPSINEPPGSNITTGDAGPVELPPLVLSDISPDAMVVGTGTFPLTVTGEGFIPDCVVVFDDAEVPTSFVSPTEIHADCPVSEIAEVVDVEVHRGDDMSDVLSFEFTAVMREGREKRTPERKPKKDTPRSKRQKKGKR